MRWLGGTVVVAALAGGLWLGKDQPALRRLEGSIGSSAAALPTLGAAPSNGAGLAAAGVHKCVGATGTVYLDRPCPAGSREAAAGGGTVTVMSFPKPAPVAQEPASGVGNGLIQGFSPEEVERLREQQIEGAANR